MTIYNWFTTSLMPLFISNFGNNVLLTIGDFVLTDLNVFNIIFCFNMIWVCVSLFVVLPFRAIKKILKFDSIKGR